MQTSTSGGNDFYDFNKPNEIGITKKITITNKDSKNNQGWDFDGVIVDDVSSDPNDWKVILDEKYKPEKDKFVLEAFNKKFGKNTFKDAQTCYEVASRNNSVGDFLRVVNKEYALVEKAPTYYRDILDPAKYEQISESLTNVRKNNAKQAEELNAATVAYKQTMKAINDKYDKRNEVLFNSKEMRILSIKSPQLPLTLSMSINAYSVAKGSVPSKKQYASELLISYKIGMLKKLVNDPSIDVDAIVANNMVK